MSNTRYQDLTANTSNHLKPMRSHLPEVMQGFGALAKAAMADGAIDEKPKELIALAIAVATRCDDCIGFHAKALVRLGGTPEELREMLGIAVYMGGGPSLMYASHAIQAYEEFAAAAK